MALAKTQNTTVEVHNSGGSFIEVGQVADVNGPGGQAAVIDTTHLKSTAKEKSMGLPDEGQLSLECVYDPADAGQARLIAMRAAQTLDSFKITLTDVGAQEITFDGYVVGFVLAAVKDGVVRASFTVEIDGAVTLT